MTVDWFMFVAVMFCFWQLYAMAKTMRRHQYGISATFALCFIILFTTLVMRYTQ
jgi:hypothetical protein